MQRTWLTSQTGTDEEQMTLSRAYFWVTFVVMVKAMSYHVTRGYPSPRRLGGSWSFLGARQSFLAFSHVHNAVAPPYPEPQQSHPLLIRVLPPACPLRLLQAISPLSPHTGLWYVSELAVIHFIFSLFHDVLVALWHII